MGINDNYIETLDGMIKERDATIDKLRVEVERLKQELVKGLPSLDALRQIDQLQDENGHLVARLKGIELQLGEARKLVQEYRDHFLDYGRRSEKGSREKYAAACQLMVFDEILEKWPLIPGRPVNTHKDKP